MFDPIFDAMFSTQGVMVILLSVYAGAMWMFLTSAPKVHTVMVSDIDRARDFYSGLLELAKADVPLHYYYGYEQSLSIVGDPMYLPTEARSGAGASRNANRGNLELEGLWYKLQKNSQLHIVPGSRKGDSSRDRHICFNRDCVEQILLRIQILGIKHKIRREKPLEFLVKDLEGQIFEIAEVKGS
jgi:catechol 2,3-dioxygenase-like lactoylglutathione lyase family enzyme